MNTTQSNAARQITNSVDALLRSIQRAEQDLAEARERILAGERPSSSLSGRILSQSALDVDSNATKLHTLLDVASDMGMELDELQQVYVAAAGKFSSR